MTPDKDEPPPPVARGERAIIEALLQGTRSRQPLGPGDDAALCADGWAWTLDTLVEGVHFDDRLDAADLGWKAVAVSVSDLAAMGATPEVVLLGLSLPSDDLVADFARGLHEALRAFDVELVGGDTTRAPVVMVTTTMGGPCTRPLRRSGGRPGDGVYVTGELGWAAEGWHATTPSPRALAALRRPTPPLAFSRDLAALGITAAMDLSDGLRTDLPRLCDASALGAMIDVDAVPGHPDARYRLAGGDDFQLLLTAPEGVDLVAHGAAHDVMVTRIGTLRPGPVVAAWPAPLFEHFGARA